LRLVERNYRCRLGELDLVMRDGEVLVFVEVRYRRSRAFGGGAESVGTVKQGRLIAAAQHYLQARNAGADPSRFDVVALDGAGCDWIRDAFHA
jgi:putative endonuclease